MSTGHPLVRRWSDLPEDRPMDRIRRKRIIGEHIMISRVELTKGFHVPTHHHGNEQLAVVLSGRMRFVLGGPAPSTVEVGAGEVMVVPPNLPHSAEALEDSVLLDVFSPPSEKTGVDRA